MALIPTEPKANALFEQAASIEATSFDPYVSKAVYEKVFKPYVNYFASLVLTFLHSVLSWVDSYFAAC